MGVEKLLTQSLKAIRLFKGTQVATLKVFDKTDLEDSPVVDIDLDAWDLGEPCLDRGTVPAFPGDDLKFLPGLPDQDRLENSLFLDGRNQVGHIAKGTTRLIRVGDQFIERDHPPDGGALT